MKFYTYIIYSIRSRTGEQGNQWKRAQINLISEVEFNVVFEGIVGKSFLGDMYSSSLIYINI